MRWVIRWIDRSISRFLCVYANPENDQNQDKAYNQDTKVHGNAVIETLEKEVVQMFKHKCRTFAIKACSSTSVTWQWALALSLNERGEANCNRISENWMWDKQIYHFVGLRKERGICWKGLSSSLLDFLISPFSFFHSEHIPVLTVHVANKHKHNNNNKMSK